MLIARLGSLVFVGEGCGFELYRLEWGRFKGGFWSDLILRTEGDVGDSRTRRSHNFVFC